MAKLNYFELFAKGIMFALICLAIKTGLGVLPAHSAEFTPSQEKQKVKAEVYLKKHFYGAFTKTQGIDGARKYVFYSIEEFNNLLDEGYSISKAKSKAMVSTYKLAQGESGYADKLDAYKQEHKGKYYAKQAMFWPMPIPHTMITPKKANPFIKGTEPPTPVYAMPTGLPNTEILHPANDPFTGPTPVFILDK